MIPSDQLEQAISIHERSYRLLKWLASAMNKGFMPAAGAHDACTGGEAALAWIERHYLNLPTGCRPSLEEMVPFANMFGSYLETSFSIVDEPGVQRVSDHNCWCAFCCRVVKASHLVPKSVDARDKSRAAKLRLRRVEALALEEGLHWPSDDAEALVTGSTRRDASLSAYGTSLLERLKGVSSGFGVLALWREIAWRNGSPDHRFKLKHHDIVAAECRLLAAMQASHVIEKSA